MTTDTSVDQSDDDRTRDDANRLIVLLRTLLAESSDIVQHLEATTGLRFSRLQQSFWPVLDQARAAHEALAVSAAGVELAPPRAVASATEAHVILARRTEAMASGSRPEPCDDYIVYRLGRPDPAAQIGPQDISPPPLPPLPEGERPQCGKETQTGLPCRNRVQSIEGRWASGCERHLDDHEKAVYEREKSQGLAHSQALRKAQQAARNKAASVTAHRWLQTMIAVSTAETSLAD
ncbi:hypothetical protein [Pseudofrankia inefficax]|uniref:hypothetical protein n=1 Tax=Pseudofrankia inefficax (strain DSM 45817 / CECT 9037 / DDB 130130 / EuI1c) TaxID=298654 RepID=UPI0001BFBA2F|nr:hypothetical protein [Pseudofrankia inefficax]